MIGSIAVWTEGGATSSCSKCNHLQIHLNVWRDLPGDQDALDVGVLCKNHTAFEQLKIFVPAYLSVSDEVVRSHTPFRKMRLLEDGLWDLYLQSLGLMRAQDMVIYQWRSEGVDGRSIDDFIALVFFRRHTNNVALYVLTTLAIGAFGSSVSSLLSSLYAYIAFALRGDTPSSYDLAPSILGILSLIAFLIIISLLARLRGKS